MHERELEGDWWTIPPERNEKGKRHHRVYLSGLAKELVGDYSGYVFPTPKKAGSGHLSLIAVQSLARAINKGPRWTPHDLRRTARTQMSRLGVRREYAEAVLNHAKEGMVKVYDQYEYDREKKEALTLWGAELLRLVR